MTLLQVRKLGQEVSLLTCLSLLSRTYCVAHRSLQRNGWDAAPFGPGFVIITFPDPAGCSPLHIFFTSLSVDGFVVPGTTAVTLIFFGVTPPTVAFAPSLIPVPVTSRKN